MDGETKPTMGVREYGSSRFGMSKNAAYEAARNGEIPTIKIGGRMYVPVKKADQQFGFTNQEAAA